MSRQTIIGCKMLGCKSSVMARVYRSLLAEVDSLRLKPMSNKDNGHPVVSK